MLGRRKICFIKEVNKFVDVIIIKTIQIDIKIDLSVRPFIEAEFTKDGWKYELPDIPQVNFNILDEGSQYCRGKLFYKADFLNWGKGNDK